MRFCISPIFSKLLPLLTLGSRRDGWASAMLRVTCVGQKPDGGADAPPHNSPASVESNVKTQDEGVYAVAASFGPWADAGVAFFSSFFGCISISITMAAGPTTVKA